jgi:hypothetical protein
MRKDKDTDSKSKVTRRFSILEQVDSQGRTIRIMSAFNFSNSSTPYVKVLKLYKHNKVCDTPMRQCLQDNSKVTCINYKNCSRRKKTRE